MWELPLLTIVMFLLLTTHDRVIGKVLCTLRGSRAAALLSLNVNYAVHVVIDQYQQYSLTSIIPSVHCLLQKLKVWPNNMDIV